MEKLRLNKKLFENFLEITHALNKEYNVKPVIWGSLGLSLVIGEFGKSHDADVLIPDNFLDKRWPEIISFMKNQGYSLKDEREHEFFKEDAIIAFANFSNIQKLKLNTIEEKIDDSVFYNLPAEEYLKLYKIFLNEPYRIKTGAVEKDKKKVELIEEYLKKSSA